jgi:type II secretion system protein G
MSCTQSACTRYGSALTTVNALHIAMYMFREDCGRYPTEKEGLTVLVVNPGSTNWQGPYLNREILPFDPWGNRFVYHLSNGEPVIVSAGPDRVFKTKDDVYKDSQYRPPKSGCARF